MEIQWMKAHLREASEELQKLLGDLEEMSEVELQLALAHVYRHLNVAWSGRHDFKDEHVGFPTEMEAFLES